MIDRDARAQLWNMQSEIRILQTQRQIDAEAIIELRAAYDELFDFLAEELKFRAAPRATGLLAGVWPRSPRRLERVTTTQVVRTTPDKEGEAPV